jgi:hypothetical protein
MQDLLVSLAIHENPCAGCGEKAGNPVPPGPREIQVLHDFQEERPCHGVKSFAISIINSRAAHFLEWSSLAED